MRIDLLIIKKPKELDIKKNIGRIFRADNIVEYKSPKDNLSIKDFWKVYSYANLYAAITPGVDLADLTITFIVGRHPGTLMRYMSKVRGYSIQQNSPGIYEVIGDYLPIQIIETKKLSEKENEWLESLRKGLNEERLSVIINEGKKRARGINIDAYLNVIMRANPRKFLEVEIMAKKKDETLEDVLTEYGYVPAWREQQARVQEKERTARNMLAKSVPIEDIAQFTELPIRKIRSLAKAG